MFPGPGRPTLSPKSARLAIERGGCPNEIGDGGRARSGRGDPSPQTAAASRRTPHARRRRPSAGDGCDYAKDLRRARYIVPLRNQRGRARWMGGAAPRMIAARSGATPIQDRRRRACEVDGCDHAKDLCRARYIVPLRKPNSGCGRVRRLRGATALQARRMRRRRLREAGFRGAHISWRCSRSREFEMRRTARRRCLRAW